MPRPPIDLRSDTVTRPSAGMREAMFTAEVGDDVLGDDPTVIRLQERTAELFGKPAALFFPSGTQANQAALHALTRRGDELFLHAHAHIIYYEQGGAAVLSGLQLRCFDSPDGTLDPEAMQEHVHTDADPHWAPTRLVALEDTHNHCGGLVYPREGVRAVREFCDRNGLLLHLDGARIWNAHVAGGVSLADIAAPCDTVSVCLSKGLGAPVGSLVVCNAELLPRLIRARKLLGGGMRQAGILAAAGLYALEHNIGRMAEDHRRARRLGERLARVPGLRVDLEKVQTNMVYADTRESGTTAADMVRHLAAAGVWCLDEGPWTIRLVTHLDVDDADVEEAGELIVSVVELLAG
ncbi:MAG: low-specificity L-threonine aldolase [Acidimicrobiia bacterium]|nr:low-specificity L-threonine aldolase [Acidimicrobiia bacterium]